MQIDPNEIHLWPIVLTLSAEEEAKQVALLSADELLRAERFHFPLHKNRFIAARSALRQLLSFYLDCHPQQITFSYAAYHKPYLASPWSDVQFNLAHSYHLGLVAVTKQQPVGVDIEKIRPAHYAAIAKRYFTIEEYHALLSLPADSQLKAFYRLWARKEAVMKAVGKGLTLPLSSFSVSLQEDYETIHLEQTHWSVVSFDMDSQFQSAVATSQPITTLRYWKLTGQVYTHCGISNIHHSGIL